MNTPSSKQQETLWIALVIMALFYTALLRVPSIEGDSGLLGKLADAFLHGQVSLLELPPPEVAAMVKPPLLSYKTESPYNRYNDYLLFHGRFFLMYGPTPVLLVFLPYQWLTGHTLSMPFVTLIFACIGTIAIIAFYIRLCRLCGLNSETRFPAHVYLLMFGTFLPVCIIPGLHYEVCLMSAYTFTALALWCLTKALDMGQRRLWLTLASLCLGLAAGSRLNFLFPGAVIVSLWSGYWLYKRKGNINGELLGDIACIALPWALCLSALLYYNEVRFGSPFDSGINYAVTAWKPLHTVGMVSPVYVLNNLYFYLINPIHLSLSPALFAPVRVYPHPPRFGVPWPSHFDFSTQEPVYGIVNAPFLCFCFATFPMCMRLAKTLPAAALMMASLWGAAFSIFAFLLFAIPTERYVVDFAPWFMVCACIGYLYLYRQYQSDVVRLRYLRWFGAATTVYTLACNISYGLQGP